MTVDALVAMVVNLVVVGVAVAGVLIRTGRTEGRIVTALENLSATADRDRREHSHNADGLATALSRLAETLNTHLYGHPSPNDLATATALEGVDRRLSHDMRALEQKMDAILWRGGRGLTEDLPPR